MLRERDDRMHNFDETRARLNTSSIKWKRVKESSKDLSDDLFALSVADLDFPYPEELIDSLKNYLEHVTFGYSQLDESYHKSVISWFKRRHNWEVEADEIVVSAGIIRAIFNLIKTFTRPGDGVLIMDPVYHHFARAINLLERSVVTSDLVFKEGLHQIDFVDLEMKIKEEKTKMMILCSPHNPVGRVWTQRELEKIAELCFDHGVLVVSDEVHFDIVRPGFEHIVFANVSDKARGNSIICTSPSKTFNLAGTKNSNLVIHNPDLRNEFQMFLEKSGSMGPDTSMFAQKATEIAYNECEYWADGLNELVDSNFIFIKKYLSENIPKIRTVELQGSYLLWLDFSDFGLGQDRLVELLENEHVFMSNGIDFSAKSKGFMRMNIAFPRDTVEKALARLKKFSEQME